MKGTQLALGLALASTGLLGALWFYLRPADVPLTKTGTALASAKKPRAPRVPLPPELAGVELGMELGFLRKSRPHMKPNPQASDAEMLVYDEQLTRSTRALYMLRRRDLVLEKLQIASQLDGLREIEPRVHEHSTRYGMATGIWDCPTRGNVYLATRRFTWEVDGAGVMDVFLVVGENVSSTLFIAPLGSIRQSLRDAGCIPTPTERMKMFPIPTAPKAP